MSNPHNIQPGQELWFVAARHCNERGEYAVTVEKVGRVWATVKNRPWRFSLETLQISGEGFSSPGDVHISRQAWEQEKERQRLWTAIARHTSRKLPDHVSAEMLQTFLRYIETP